MPSFSGLWVPLVTPFKKTPGRPKSSCPPRGAGGAQPGPGGAFTPDGAVDYIALAKLVRRLVKDGVHGLVVGGTTGEAAMLSDPERAAVLHTVACESGPTPLVVGVGGVTPADVAGQVQQVTRSAEAPRVVGFLVPPPLYVRPSPEGVIDFFAQVAAAAAPRAVVVYDIPYRTGVELSLPTLRALARLPGVVAVKDCGGDARKTQALIADGALQVLAGEDAQIFTSLCQGAAGAIAASAHLHTPHFVALVQAVAQGQWARARHLHHALAPLVHALFAEPNPGPVKAVLAALGEVSAAVRAPLTPASAQAVRQAVEVHATCGEVLRRLS